MNTLDIILGIPLLYAVYRGFRDGVMVQLAGLVGILAGIWLAFRYSAQVGTWLKLDPDVSTPAAFVLIVLATLLGLGILGRILSKIFSFAGLGMFDKAGGIVVAVAKMTLILSVLSMAFSAINLKTELVKPQTLAGSVLYKPISGAAQYVFPYLSEMKEMLTDNEAKKE